MAPSCAGSDLTSLGALVGSATTISSGNLFTSGANQALGLLGLRWRLFDFGRVDAQIAAAHGQEAEALATYRLAVLRARARARMRPTEEASSA
jgi:outer membrane protein TolC